MLSLRPATPADARRLFEWRNDPLTRANSRSPDEIAWADHLAWLVKALASPDQRLLIVEVGATAAATIRFDLDESVEASFTIAPEWRGKGLSLRMMKLALEAGPASELWIKQQNRACQRLVAAAGGEMLEEGELQHWRYVPGSHAAPVRIARAGAKTERLVEATHDGLARPWIMSG